MNLQLPDSLDLKAAAPLRATLLGARGAALALDAQNVQRLGGLCLQVLLSAEATWAIDRQSFTISAASPAFIEGARRMGARTLAPEQIIQE